MASTGINLSDFSNIDIQRAKNGLIYDAETVTLIGKYGDELTAHRNKKEWLTVLSSHFLLEQDKDYELNTFSSLEENIFLLACTFTSACGRYAFWRLANRQASEAEQKLNGTNEKIQKSARGFLGGNWGSDSKETTLVVSALEEQIQRNQENTGMMKRILRLFQ